MASSAKNLITSKQKTILNGATEIVDAFPFSGWVGAVEYTIIAEATIGTRLKTLKLIAEKKGSGVEDQVFNRFGAAITLQITTKVTGLNVELEIINNDTVPVIITIIRIKH